MALRAEAEVADEAVLPYYHGKAVFLVYAEHRVMAQWQLRQLKVRRFVLTELALSHSARSRAACRLSSGMGTAMSARPPDQRTGADGFRHADFALHMYRDRIDVADRRGRPPQQHAYPLAEVAAIRSTPDSRPLLTLVDGPEVDYALDAAAADVRKFVAGLL